MKNIFKFFRVHNWWLCAAAVAAGFLATACISLPGATPTQPPPPPPPTSLIITGIPDAHNGRQAVVRLLDADNEIATAHPVLIADGSIRLDMLYAETETPIVARGNYVVDIEIATTILGRPLPVPTFLGIIPDRNVTEGTNSIQWTDFTPTPVSILITGIPAEHNGRTAVLRLVAVGLGLDVATASPVPIIDGSVRIDLVDNETQEPFFARGAYAVGLVISMPPFLGIGPPIPRWGGISAALNISGGSQTILFSSFVGAGL